MYVEEISLSAAVDDLESDQSSEDQHAVAMLEQANWLRHCRSKFTLFNNHCLSINTQGAGQNPRDYMIDTGILDPQPKRLFRICWSCFILFSVLCGAAWVFALNSLIQNATLVSIILSACAGLSLVLAVYRSHDRVVFYSQTGRVPLVVLFNRLPNRAMLDTFSDALVQHINDAKADYQGAIEALNAELKAHRLLMEEGILSRKRYDIAKQRILIRHSDKAR